MKSLEERHEARAIRKFANAAESNAGNVSGRISNVASLMEQAHTAFNSLTDDEKRELTEAFEGFDPSSGQTYLAEDDEGNFKYAGVGIVNPFVVPAAEYPAPVDMDAAKEQAGNGGGAAWGGGNLNGVAVAEAAVAEAGSDGWGSSGAEGEGDGKPETAAQKKAREKAEAEAAKAADNS